MKRLIVFDLDGTLAESTSSLDAEMSARLRELLSIVKVAVRVRDPDETKRVIETIIACFG